MRERRGWMVLVSLSLSACTPVFSPADLGEPSNPHEEARMLDEAYGRTARRLAALPESFRTRERAARYGLEVVDVLREAAARANPAAPDFREPSVGIEVRLTEGARAVTAVLAPAFRSPSASPMEVRTERFFLRVGNHHGEPRRTVPLSRFLSDIGRYVTSPASLTGASAVGERLSLSAPRDSHVLVEVRAVAVPVPARGRAAVRPIVLSSASSPRSPAVLVIAGSRDGTSLRVIENRPEDRSLLGSGQAVDFNDGGERRAFALGPRAMEALTVIEVPLVQGRVDVRGEGDPRGREPTLVPAEAARQAASAAGTASSAPVPSTVAGPFLEGYGDRVERDENRVLRATVFLLYPVQDGELSDGDWEAIAGRLRAVGGRPDVAGAVVLPENDARRPPL